MGLRDKLIIFLKQRPNFVNSIYKISRLFLGSLIKLTVQKKTILFCSFGGRNFNDSPKAIYDEICQRKDFNDWNLVWAFVNPDKYEIPRGKKIKIDTLSFFRNLISSKIWVSNTGIDRGIDLLSDRILRVETWHGAPLKKICGEENQNSSTIDPRKYKGPIDKNTIRCAQSEFDRDIFARVFHADVNSFLLSDLPRNDELLTYGEERLHSIRKSFGIDDGKKIILYTPTYREYLINKNSEIYIAPPLNLYKWEKEFGEQYVLLIRAHYAVSKALDIKENNFVKNVSSYSSINDLYAISDIMITDYSSTYFDFSILERPMICFAYDKEEYEEKRGLYLNLEKDLPCKVCRNEDEVIFEIKNMNSALYIEAAKEFHKKYAPYAGSASKKVVDLILHRLNKNFSISEKS